MSNSFLFNRVTLPQLIVWGGTVLQLYTDKLLDNRTRMVMVDLFMILYY